MTTCTETALTKGAWKHKQGLDMKLNTDATISEVTFLYRPDGDIGYNNARLREGETWIVNEYTDRGLSWELTFDMAYDWNTARITVCNTSSEIPEPEPEPEPEPPTGDGASIEEIQSVVDNQTFSVLNKINETESSLSRDITDVVGQLVTNATKIDGILTSVTGLIDGLQSGITTQITGLSTSLTGGIQAISDKIDGLTFPTLDSIKAAFLDVCADLATALWDAILDKIEERYPKDEEETK